MTKISQLTRQQYLDIQESIPEQVAHCSSLEEAAQKYVSVLYDSLEESVVLARLFATLPLSELGETQQAFVRDLAQSSVGDEPLPPSTNVLTLMGSRGVMPDWNDRKKSDGHVGIPLVSSEFIEQIPMMSRLLHSLGAGLDWIDSSDSDMVVRTVGQMTGVFYVADASSEIDQKGRKIIAAQDFVDEHQVKTVFGIGGGYLGTSLFFTTILFLRETVDKEITQRFMLQANKFKTATLDLAISGKFFSGGPE